jgi:hypothetical protein
VGQQKQNETKTKQKREREKAGTEVKKVKEGKTLN